MPTYIVHGFRWPRDGTLQQKTVGIRIHCIMHQLSDASSSYIMNTRTQSALLASFHAAYPQIMAQLPTLSFVEQHDSDDVEALLAKGGVEPYAFVCDVVRTVKLSADLQDVMSVGSGAQTWEALAQLRDRIAPEARIGWFVVHNGDPERAYDLEGDVEMTDDEEEDEDDEDEGEDDVDKVGVSDMERKAENVPRVQLPKHKKMSKEEFFAVPDVPAVRCCAPSGNVLHSRAHEC